MTRTRLAVWMVILWVPAGAQGAAVSPGMARGIQTALPSINAGQAAAAAGRLAAIQDPWRASILLAPLAARLTAAGVAEEGFLALPSAERAQLLIPS